MKKTLLMFLVLFSIAFSNAYAQTRKITGKVVGADDGAPLPGVSVSIKGSTRGVITDGDGKFFLSASTGETLQITFIGYNSVTMPVTAANDYQVKLKTDTKLLTEVVVSDSYGSQAKKTFTGAAATVNGKDNENKPFTSPLQALQGEVPGLNVSSFSGQPGANIQVRLRGLGSISEGSNPLYVVDGAIINAGDISRLTTTTSVLAGLNEDDIESVTVLKDAAATAIYGSRGSNGVIVITTKRGKNGKTQVNFSSEFGITNNLPIPEGGKPLTAAEFTTLFTEGLVNGGSSPASVAANVASFANPAGPSNNWYELVTRRGNQRQYNVSASGGGETTKVFASAGYFQQQATTIASDLRRITGQLNLDQTVSKRISFSITSNVSNVLQHTPSDGGTFASPILSAFFLRPNQVAYNPDGSVNSSVVGNTNFSSIYNPIYLAIHNNNSDNETRLLGTGTVKWNIWDQLKYTGFASMDYLSIEENIFSNPIMGDGAAAHGRAQDNYSRYANYTIRNQLDYRYNIPKIEDFYVDAKVGYESQKSGGYLLNTQATLFPATQPLLTSGVNGATPVTAQQQFNDYTFDSFYSSLGINYKQRYSLSGSFRRDGSSEFGSLRPYGNFYSVGSAWNIDGENFFKTQKIFSSAKFRASYGETGNAQFSSANTISGAYSAQPTAGYGANYAGNNGQNYSTVGNPSLTWESAKKTDVGADFGFFNDRLLFTVDYYHNLIDGLIQNVPISRTTGFPSISENVGSMLNRGWEFSVKGTPIRSRDFTWNTNFNIAFNKNTVESLYGGLPIVTAELTAVGKDIQTWDAREYAGVDPATGNALWYTDATRKTTTTNYAAASVVPHFQADPKYFGGFSNTFNYKNIIVSADFYYNFGNMIEDSWAFYLTDGTNITFNKYQYDYDRRWTTPGQITDVPKYVNGGTNAGQSSSFSDRFLYYGDYIRLKNLTAGYDLKNIAWIKSLGISRLYVYGRATNLWTKTYDSKLPFDPEVGTSGASNLEVPAVRTFTLGINVGL